MKPMLPAARQPRTSHFDFKSVAAGLLLGVVLALAVAAGGRASQPGRYSVAVGGGHAFILDTATGQAWEKFTLASEGNSSPDFLEPKLK